MAQALVNCAGGDKAVDAGRVQTADSAREVVRVFNAIQHDDEGRSLYWQQIRRIAKPALANLGQYAAMRLAASPLLNSVFCDEGDWNIGFISLAQQDAESPVITLPAINQNPMNIAPAGSLPP